MPGSGHPHCGECGSKIAQQSADVIRDSLSALPAKTKIVLLAPMVRGRRGAASGECLKKSVSLDSSEQEWMVKLILLDDVPPLAPKKNHTIEAVVDRIVVVREGVEFEVGASHSNWH